MWKKKTVWGVTVFLSDTDEEGESFDCGIDNTEERYADSYEEAAALKEMLLAGEDEFYGNLVIDCTISDGPVEKELWE